MLHNIFYKNINEKSSNIHLLIIYFLKRRSIVGKVGGTLTLCHEVPNLALPIKLEKACIVDELCDVINRLSNKKCFLLLNGEHSLHRKIHDYSGLILQHYDDPEIGCMISIIQDF